MIEPEDDPRAIPKRQASIEVLPRSVFIEQWKKLVGEPPATMLESRSLMLALLVESVPAKGLAPEDIFPLTWSSTQPESSADGAQAH